MLSIYAQRPMHDAPKVILSRVSEVIRRGIMA
jgi:hypothetical protein